MPGKKSTEAIKKGKLKVLLVCVFCTLPMCIALLTIFDKNIYVNGHHKPSPNASSFKDLSVQSIQPSPWKNVPQFQMHLQMFSWSRLVNEYERWFLRSYKLFFPPERARDALVLVFNGESQADHETASALKRLWPYPRLCFRPLPKDPDMYQQVQRYRMYYEQFYPEYCITSEFVGYVDSDVVWSSVVTPGSLFEKGKPIINAKIGPPFSICWAQTTHYLLGFKEILQCMTYFPVIIKVQHVVELRNFIAKRMQVPFEVAFTNALKIGKECLCQYSVMCNYVWHFHRNEYKFHLQMRENGNWDGKLNASPSSASLEYLRNTVSSIDTLPKPRVALHIRHLLTKENVRYFDFDLHVPPVSIVIEKILSESFCYLKGFDKCPEGCKQFDKTAPFYYLYTFEWDVWLWDNRCKAEQDKYLQEAKALLNYYEKTKQTVLGLQNTDELCWYII